ncbi:hypothetical protein DACRYDRAFT_24439 [Dacryopinax primogenitus]|uniref:Cytochrome c oxidase assembly protein COX16, mitochondrial n=1 Tax=Dacryopinax primogenitus (strain DJM 731) TaxID=1858805 RepID=M5FRM9_DACPD|nr:uncharacterized protein DACRYDRAFT_24439 [Dacryopinax primogenitus]EJT98378.1 hypothetical protein DACRYDRAFT_24439 [Dacryopinax primogenitus]
MAAFTSRRRSNHLPFTGAIRKQPFLLFGLPFLTLIVFASFGLQTLTQTRYDYQRNKTTKVTKEEELQMSKNRKKVDIREEYFRLQAGESKIDLDNWEPVRIQRPEGTPEWGVPPSAPPSDPANKDASGKT